MNTANQTRQIAKEAQNAAVDTSKVSRSLTIIESLITEAARLGETSVDIGNAIQFLSTDEKNAVEEQLGQLGYHTNNDTDYGAYVCWCDGPAEAAEAREVLEELLEKLFPGFKERLEARKRGGGSPTAVPSEG